MRKREIFNPNISLPDNSILRWHPRLFYEWNFEQNDKLGLNIYKIAHRSNKVVWWICPDCESEYDMVLSSRTSRSSNCPYCAGRRVNHTNSIASLKPNLAKEWHPTKNGDLTPDNFTCGSNEKAWWIGKCGHYWEATIYDRAGANETNCPYCAPNPKVLVGFNDMCTTNPELAKLLLNPKDGYRYTQSSNVKVDWKCLDCGNVVKNKIIRNIHKWGVFCSRCSDGVSFPEKFMYYILKESNIEFDFDVPHNWSQRKRYDFYLPKFNWIIEVHGEQHFRETFERIGREARTLKEERENDRLKERLAKENGVDNYIIIDASESTVEHIRSNILNSDIVKIVNEKNLDFEKIGRLASDSFIKVVCELWNSGNRSTTCISEILNIHRQTVLRHLKRGVEIGWCDYTTNEAYKNSGKKSGDKKRIPIVQLGIDFSFIKAWDSIKEAGISLSIFDSGISMACKGKLQSSGGFKWMYKEDYDKRFNSLVKY